ncbi:MAG: DUF1338 family protein [Marinilabiliales bacterium]|nr:DUF1338 family protein [Marinilabiliales bacterium]
MLIRPWFTEEAYGVRYPFATYNRLREESEYAAWLLVYGYRANHFAVKVNELKKFSALQEVNEFVKGNGYLMTTVGGEIYGTPEELLEQSATMAEIQPVEFTDGVFEIPSCFYEFTLRYNLPDGKQYSSLLPTPTRYSKARTIITNRQT